LTLAQWVPLQIMRDPVPGVDGGVVLPLGWGAGCGHCTTSGWLLQSMLPPPPPPLVIIMAPEGSESVAGLSEA
jgi:hypothetical protein